jgi:hypothetical protein
LLGLCAPGHSCAPVRLRGEPAPPSKLLAGLQPYYVGGGWRVWLDALTAALGAGFRASRGLGGMGGVVASATPYVRWV